MHDDKMMKMLKSKKGKELSAPEKQAKMSVLKDLHEMASKAMGEKLQGLKKVTVASDSKEGLEKGLEKAQELVGGPGEESAEADEEAQEASEEASEGEAPEAEMSEEELDAKLAELMALKEKMKKA